MVQNTYCAIEFCHERIHEYFFSVIDLCTLSEPKYNWRYSWVWFSQEFILRCFVEKSVMNIYTVVC
jgi:hypothetical protein